MNLLIKTLLAISILFACSDKKTSLKTIKNIKLEKLWETDTLLNDVESVIYDTNNNVLYTSNINGHWLKKNGKGFISKVGLQGNILQHKWLEQLEGPTGSAIDGNTLYVADFNTVVAIDIPTQNIIKKYLIEGTERINDLTIDANGIIYGTDSKRGVLFSLNNGKTSLLKTDIEWPNGVLYEKDALLIGLGDKTIEKFQLNNNTATTMATGISNPDGIIRICNGNYLISSWEGMIYYVTKEGDKKLLLDSRKENINAADMTYIPSLKMLIVPAMLHNKLIAYKVNYEL